MIARKRTKPKKRAAPARKKRAAKKARRGTKAQKKRATTATKKKKKKKRAAPTRTRKARPLAGVNKTGRKKSAVQATVQPRDAYHADLSLPRRKPIELSKVAAYQAENREPVGAIAFSRDGKRLAVAFSRGLTSKKTVGKVAVYDVARQPLHVSEVHLPGGCVEVLALSPNGSYVACGRRGERGVQLVDATTGKVTHTLDVPSPTSLAFAPDGARLAIGVYSPDEKAGRVVVIDAKGGAELFRSPPYRQDVIGLSFMPDGLVLVGAMDWWGALVAWDVDAGRELYRLPEFDDDAAPARRGRAVAASADGLSYATCDGTRVDVWSVAGAEKKATVDVGSVPQTLALNHDGSVLFVGSPDAAAWSVGSGARLASLDGPGLVAVHPDGKRVVVASSVVPSEGPALVPVR